MYDERDMNYGNIAGRMGVLMIARNIGMWLVELIIRGWKSVRWR